MEIVKTMVKTKQINFRVDETTKKDLDAILNELNKHSKEKITISTIIDDYITNYRSSTPHGLKLETEKLKQELNNKKDQVRTLNDEITRLKTKIEKNEEIINNTNPYDISNYANNEELTHAINSLKEYVKNKEQYEKLTDLPKDVLEDVAKQHTLSCSDLINIIEYNFKDWTKTD